jgi:hypothetical protein
MSEEEQRDVRRGLNLEISHILDSALGMVNRMSRLSPDDF